MKKRFFIPACVLAAAAFGFVIYAMGHPELSFPWSTRITHIFYGLYADAVILLFLLAFRNKLTCLNILTILFELGAVFFLVQSVLTVFPTGKANWYLPIALGLNCVGIVLARNPAEKTAKIDNESEFVEEMRNVESETHHY